MPTLTYRSIPPNGKPCQQT
ncbi:MAG: hypothetical protein CMA04_007610 [Methanobacteriota archaeon]|nr:MAG: hypothetical protein CMA04_007610 [Euryarchaeota archaeon]